jgi:hypothetical protein
LIGLNNPQGSALGDQQCIVHRVADVAQIIRSKHGNPAALGFRAADKLVILIIPKVWPDLFPDELLSSKLAVS